MPDHKILFLPSHKTAPFETGTTYLDAALELGILIESTCAGIGTCGKCKVEVREGVSDVSKDEEQILTPQEIRKGVRLSCQARIQGPGVCVVPPESKAMADQIMTEGHTGRFPLAPDTRKIHLSVPEPQLGEKYFDHERVLSLLGSEIRSGIDVARALPAMLRANEFSVTAVLDGDRLIAVEAGDTTTVLLGVAVDIGTTTLAAKLVNLIDGTVLAVASDLNPQKRYGADVVSRVNYCVEHEGGLGLMHQLIVKKLNELVEDLCRKASVARHDIYKMVVVGNTVMQHFVLKIDPRHLTYRPYAPAFQGPITLSASDLGIAIHPSGCVYAVPGIASFVGSDITAVLTVLDIGESEEVHAVVDIGTNGEMVLGSRDRLLCCSSPAGPAWEGANITWGMRAARGAIERAAIIDGDLKYRTIGDIAPVGICGSGLLDLVCEFVRAGMIDKTGRILGAGEIDAAVSSLLRNRIVPRETGANDIRIAAVGESESILLTQKDIREVQLAKSAIASGLKVLLNELVLDARDLRKILVAGAFGNHVRGEDAIDSGLLPNLDPENIRFIGNAALSGAEAILLSRQARMKAEQLSGAVEYVEISDRAGFNDLFVESMHFPDTNSARKGMKS